MKKLSDKERKEIGNTLSDSFEKLEQSLATISTPPDFSKLTNLIKAMEGKKALLTSTVLQMKEKLKAEGISTERE
jgi:vacuolar-type H+-ATPase subunit E/Vma4|tara:strand:+ start:948 stop:1172 length:225 start_codon:yes stop_codon:yes gene_type:complete